MRRVTKLRSGEQMISLAAVIFIFLLLLTAQSQPYPNDFGDEYETACETRTKF
jgi:hypothetical protein